MKVILLSRRWNKVNWQGLILFTTFILKTRFTKQKLERWNANKMKIQFQFPNAMRCNKFSFPTNDDDDGEHETTGKTLEKILKIFSHGNGVKNGKKEKMEHCRRRRRVLQNCLGKRNFSILFHYQKKHHMTEFSIFSAGTICILFFPFLCCCRNVLQEIFSFFGAKKKGKQEKWDWIDQTNIRAAPNDFQTLAEECTYIEDPRKREKSQKTHHLRKEKHVTHRLWEDIAMNGIKSFAKDPKKRERLWRANTFLVMSCRKMTLVNLLFSLLDLLSFFLLYNLSKFNFFLSETWKHVVHQQRKKFPSL